MKTFGKSVRLYLNEGIVTEIKFFELVNWTIQGLVCPRSRIAELKNWPESQRPGVYVLLGDDETGEFKFSAYIGESEDVFDRLKTHLNQSDCKGSTAVAKAADSLQGGYKEIRDELIKSLILLPTGGKLIFEKDYMFNSPSAAATVVAGSPRSGNVTWKDTSGKTLKEIEASKMPSNE